MRVLLFACSTAACLLAAVAGAAEPATLEARVISAVVEDRPKLLAALVEEIQALPAEQKDKLPFRVYREALEMRFEGVLSTAFSRDFLEYLVSVRQKDYETLVVVGEADIQRLSSAQKLFEARKDGAPMYRFQLAWSEDGEARVEDLRDIIATADPKLQQRFLNELRILEAGLGGELNLKSDISRLPKGEAKVTGIITFELAPKFREALK
jgi:hypothetical protein